MEFKISIIAKRTKATHILFKDRTEMGTGNKDDIALVLLNDSVVKGIPSEEILGIISKKEIRRLAKAI